MHVPEVPDEWTLKAVLMELPAPPPPLIPVLRADKPTLNDRVYPAEVLARTARQAQQQIKNRTMLVYLPHEHGLPMELSDACGFVERLEFDGTHLLAQVSLFKQLDVPAERLTFTTTGHGHISGGGVVDDYQMDGVMAVCNPVVRA